MKQEKVYLKMLVVVAILVAAFVGCNKPSEYKTDKPTENNAYEKSAGLVYPHDQEFKRTHGKFYDKNKVQCASCHGGDWAGGSAKVACSSCHNFPHPGSWALPGNHGKFAAEAAVESDQKLKDTCLNCHGKESNLISCQSCHKVFPHPPEFRDPEQFMPLHPELAVKPDGKCTVCHSDFKKYIPTDKYANGCLDCHSGSTAVSWKEGPKTTRAKMKGHPTRQVADEKPKKARKPSSNQK